MTTATDDEYSPQDYPVAITLRFKSVAEKDFFMGGLSDGWGENEAGLTWDKSLTSNDPDTYSFSIADTFLVDPFHDEDYDE